MDAENPTSLRRLFLRVAATLLALVVLYALSVGPADYLVIKLRKPLRVLDGFYTPLDLATEEPRLNDLRHEYETWWVKLAHEYQDQ